MLEVNQSMKSFRYFPCQYLKNAHPTGDGIPAEMQKMNDGEASYCKRESPPEFSLTVAQTSPNSFGLHDTIGNVEEWCSDWYDYYPARAVTDPPGPDSGEERVLRGGSWGDDPDFVRSAFRGRLGPGFRDVSIGFRLARSP